MYRTFYEPYEDLMAVLAGQNPLAMRAKEDIAHSVSLASARRFMSKYRRVPHFVPATCRKRAGASISADLPSGNVPTALRQVL